MADLATSDRTGHAGVAAADNAPDAACAALLASLRAELGTAVLDAAIQRHEVIVRISRDSWTAAAIAAKRKLGLTYFCFLSGMDWMDSPTQTTRYENVWGSVEDDAEPIEDGADANAVAVVDEPAVVDAVAVVDEPDAAPVAGFRTGVAGGESRFQVMMRLVSPSTHRGITIKADLDDVDPRVPTISGVFAGADWHERETWEMFGFWFDGHPNLIHIYLPHGFEGYPLRKDFPLLAREVKPWPGLTNVEPISGEGAAEEVTADA